MHKSILLSELLWLLITVILVILVGLPIYSYGVPFDHWFLLIASYVILALFLRLIFVMQWHPIRSSIWIQATLLFTCLPLFVILFDATYNFFSYVDLGEFNADIEKYDLGTRNFLFDYVKTVTVLGAVGALITTAVMPIRLLVSIWKLYRKKEGA